ncbi:MAG: response regulator transcription factor [Alkalispirochaetaceae bacterium]
MKNGCICNFMRSARRIATIAMDPSITLERGLARLSSIVIGDFPKAMYKLQVVEDETEVRVVAEFATPRLQSFIDTYREELGPLDVRKAVIPFHEGSIIGESLYSFDETRLTERERIWEYYAAHFDRADAEALGRVILEDLGVKEVLLLPVRPEDRPFGLLSISSVKELSPEEGEYWRLVATSIAALYRSDSNRRREGLLRLSFHNSAQASLLLDATGGVMDVNYALVQALDYADRESTLRGIGDFRRLLAECRESGFVGGNKGELFLKNAYGHDLPFRVDCRELYEPGGAVIGAVFRLQQAERSDSAPRLLSRRQREVGRRIAMGESSKEIALELGLSVHTVNYHRAQLRKRLEVSGRGEKLADELRTLFVS